jgi:hypothetical protein
MNNHGMVVGMVFMGSGRRLKEVDFGVMALWRCGLEYIYTFIDLKDIRTSESPI